MKTKYVYLLLLPLAACAPKERNEPVRQGVQQITAGARTPLAPLQGALDTVELKACERLSALTREAPAGERFSYFARASEKRGSWKGSLEIAESPFTQFILGEKFAAGDEEEFYKKAKEEHEAGRIGTMKWFFVKFMRGIGALSVVQYSATNDKLAENFPGIFGERGPMEGALFFKLARRASLHPSLSPADAASIFTARTNLFPGTGEWKEYATGSRLSLGAAISGLKSDSPRERLCAHILLHRHFAQLLRIKGYQSPIVRKPSRKGRPHWIEELSRSQPEFARQEVPGAIFDFKTGKDIVLPDETISRYNPANGLLGLRSKVPGTASAGPGGLGEALSLMEALTYGFEATSPASSLAKEKGYFYGDVSAENGKAFLPAEAHALSLGLLTMHFKNLAALHVIKVNAEGSKLGDGETAAGIALSSGDWKGSLSTLRLADALRLARVTSYLESAMERFLEGRPEDWERLNPVYSRKTLASLFGSALFTEEELSGLLSPEERKSVLRDSLNALKLPLALLISKLGTGERGCASAVEWNAETGGIRPLAPCTVAERAEMADVFVHLAHDSNSYLLKRKAEQIRESLR